MLFNSVEYLIFLPVVVSFYFLIPFRFRWMLLLAASYYFYMSWKAEYVILILFSTTIDFFLARRMGQLDTQAERRPYLILSLCSNMSILFAFKYFNFFNDSARAFFDSINIFYNVPAFDVLLPVGISFYTFQTASYSIDVFRGVKKPETHFGIFALYISFFPQLVAGPIERSTRLLPQFHQQFDFDYDRVASGLRLIGWGLFKKMVIADQIAIYVDAVYNDPTSYSGLSLIVATYLFAYQIYCDFSGYSDIAIGSARILGYDLMKNFDQPYLSTSIAQFWRRWHISLSTWFRDYLYIPLGGNRVAEWRWYYNLMVVFIVSGLWHGANWTFIVWGTLHGGYLVAALITNKYFGRWLPNADEGSWQAGALQLVNIVITFHLVVFAWIFFRANSLSDALYIISNLHVNLSLDYAVLQSWGMLNATIAIVSIVLLELVEYIKNTKPFNFEFNLQPVWFRWAVYYGIAMWVLFFGNLNTSANFIYFQF